jgi:MFS family permease
VADGHYLQHNLHSTFGHRGYGTCSSLTNSRSLQAMSSRASYALSVASSLVMIRVSLIVSSILVPAAISSFFAGKLADRQGRTRGIAIGSSIFALGAAIEAASVHIGMFVFGRVVAGVGEGLYLGTLVV